MNDEELLYWYAQNGENSQVKVGCWTFPIADLFRMFKLLMEGQEFEGKE